MSWHFSLALVEKYSGGNFSDGRQCAPSKSKNGASKGLCKDKTKDTLNYSQFVPDSFWWPTPTTPTGGGNCGGSGATKKAKKLGVYIPRSINPNHYEWLMGWPIGWTDSEPLGTDKFQQWRQLHSKYCSNEEGFKL